MVKNIIKKASGKYIYPISLATVLNLIFKILEHIIANKVKIPVKNKIEIIKSDVLSSGQDKERFFVSSLTSCVPFSESRNASPNSAIMKYDSNMLNLFLSRISFPGMIIEKLGESF